MDLLGLYEHRRHPKKLKLSYDHKDQSKFYPGEQNRLYRDLYRFNKSTVEFLAEQLDEEIGPIEMCNNATRKDQRLCIALMFYASGASQKVIGSSENVSQATVSRCVRRVSRVLARLADVVGNFAVDDDIQKKVAEGFYGFSGSFPNVAGAVDGTHIPIKAPKVNPEQYVNREGKFTMAAGIIVNHRGAITHCSCRWPGSVHDSRILDESYMQDVLDARLLGRYYLLGDSGYRCQTNLLTPFRNPDTEEKLYFNECLSKTRVKVEQVIGMLKKKFQCLTKKMEYEPELVSDIIMACVFLWNYGLLVGDNKGFHPDQYVVPHKAELDRRLAPTVGGYLRRLIVCEYLWAHK